MSAHIKTIDFEPKRQTFAHVARRFGDKPASRYQEGIYDIQATENFHYKPLWEPEFWTYDARKTAVVMEDWYKPVDPRQYYYATYNISRATMNQSVERNFTFVEDRGLLRNIPDETRARLVTGLVPLRHLHWGANMNMTEITQRGYGAAVTGPCIFSAGDHLGMAQIVSRIGLELDSQTGTCLETAKQAWLTDAAWQGVREFIEHSFVERDWFKLFVIQALGVNAVQLAFAYKALDSAWREAVLPVAMLTEFMADWLTDETRWTDAVIRIVAAESAHNKALISGWAAEVIGLAKDAAATLAEALLGEPDGAIATAEAARARARALGLDI